MKTIRTLNPATGSILTSYPVMSEKHIQHFIFDMHHAQRDWAATPVSVRQKCLQNTAQQLRQHLDEYSMLITNEMGKPITQAKQEIEKCAKLCDYYASAGESFLHEETIKTEYQKSYRAFLPLGIVFAIMPWNFPFWQVLRFAVPNLMLGNAGLLKPAPITTGCGLAIEKMLVNAGFPENLFKTVVMDVELSSFIIQHPHVMGVTLTGSNATGKIVAQEAGAALKKVVMELGGNDPYVILEDADLDLAATQCVMSRLNNAGQICISAKRMIVIESVASQFQDLVAEKAQAYQMGNPLQEQTTLGPLARADLRDKVHDQVQRSIRAGAKCITGGKLPTGNGFYYPPTILHHVTPDSPSFTEEIFGPVISITHAKDEQEALHLANKTQYGLAAAIFSKDVARAEQLARQHLNAGTCAVNTLVASDPRLPFGGIKQSGFGRELSLEGMREFANIKTVIVK